MAADAVVLVVDATDVVIQQQAAVLFERASRLARGGRVVFGAEAHCFS